MATYRGHVLVVDDDPMLRTLVCTILRLHEISTEEAANGKDAIEKLTARSYDAVVIDLMMPIHSGFEVLEYLQRERPSTRCAVVISAASQQALQRTETQPVVSVALRKPFDIDELLEAVLRCIETRVDR